MYTPPVFVITNTGGVKIHMNNNTYSSKGSKICFNITKAHFWGEVAD